MCQILGFSSKTPLNWGKYWDNFRAGATNNPHGWGIAYGTGQGLAVVKEPVPGDLSPLAAALGQAVIPSSVMIGHIRYATKGKTALVNTHPFFARINGRDWAMVHNGHLSRYGSVPGQHGDTDSEAFFMRLAAAIEFAGDSDEYTVAEVIAEEVKSAGEHGMLNLLVTDGENLYIHTNRPGTLHQSVNRASALFCTVPLAGRRNWKPVSACRVHVYRGGEFVYRTSPYRNAEREVTWHVWHSGAHI